MSAQEIDYEERLSILARTPKWEFPEEFTQFHRTLSSSVSALDKSQSALSHSEVFDCDAQEKAQSCSDKIVQAVQGTELKQQLTDLQTYIARCNIAIDKAQFGFQGIDWIRNPSRPS